MVWRAARQLGGDASDAEMLDQRDAGAPTPSKMKAAPVSRSRPHFVQLKERISWRPDRALGPISGHGLVAPRRSRFR